MRSNRASISKNRATILYGAPPLIAEKALQGELDAALEFWNFAADLEGKGFARAIEIADVEKALGAKGDVVITGYVFDDAFAAKNRDALDALLRHDGEGEGAHRHGRQGLGRRRAAHRPEGRGDARHLSQALYRGRSRSAASRQEEADAAALYRVLAEIGGEKLVGPGKTLDPGTFYKRRAPALIRLASLAALILVSGRSAPGSPIRAACRVRSPSSTRS